MQFILTQNFHVWWAKDPKCEVSLGYTTVGCRSVTRACVKKKKKEREGDRRSRGGRRREGWMEREKKRWEKGREGEEKKSILLTMLTPMSCKCHTFNR